MASASLLQVSCALAAAAVSARPACIATQDPSSPLRARGQLAAGNDTGARAVALFSPARAKTTKRRGGARVQSGSAWPSGGCSFRQRVPYGRTVHGSCCGCIGELHTCALGRVDGGVAAGGDAERAQGEARQIQRARERARSRSKVRTTTVRTPAAGNTGACRRRLLPARHLRTREQELRVPTHDARGEVKAHVPLERRLGDVVRGRAHARHPRVRAHVREGGEQVGEAGRPLAKRADDERADRREQVETRQVRAHLARLPNKKLLVELSSRAPPLAADGSRPSLGGLAAAGVRLAVARRAGGDQFELACKDTRAARWRAARSTDSCARSSALSRAHRSTAELPAGIAHKNRDVLLYDPLALEQSAQRHARRIGSELGCGAQHARAQGAHADRAVVACPTPSCSTRVRRAQSARTRRATARHERTHDVRSSSSMHATPAAAAAPAPRARATPSGSHFRAISPHFSENLLLRLAAAGRWTKAKLVARRACSGATSRRRSTTSPSLNRLRAAQCSARRKVRCTCAQSTTARRSRAWRTSNVVC